jgi:SAM-dependent methyltransferase
VPPTRAPRPAPEALRAAAALDAAAAAWRAAAGPAPAPALRRALHRAAALLFAAREGLLPALPTDRLPAAVALGAAEPAGWAAAVAGLCPHDPPALHPPTTTQVEAPEADPVGALCAAAPAGLWAARAPLAAWAAEGGPASDLGLAYDSLLGDDPDEVRKGAGAWYTPDAVVALALDLALTPALATDGPLPAVLDPACGAGHFLVAAARRLRAAAGPDPAARRVATLRVFGVELDPGAAELCRLRLWLDAADPALPLAAFDAQVQLGDALLGLPHPAPAPLPADPAAWCAAHLRPGAPPLCPLHWPLVFPRPLASGGFDVVVGNPPFLAARSARTARPPATFPLLDAGLPGLRTATTDAAALFLARALDLCRPGGRVALVQPLSLLATAGAGPTRQKFAAEARLAGLWWSEAPVFPGATVRVCLPVFEKGAVEGAPAPRWEGAPPTDAVATGAEALPPGGQSWGPLCAGGGAALGGAILQISGQVRDLAEVTADFRDQFYGLIPFVREAGAGHDGPRLLTSGLIEPLASAWGARPCRFGGVRYEAPVVDLAALRTADPRLGAWAEARLRPKLIVATQAKIIEACVDLDGTALNTVPTIAALPHDPAALWRLLAALLAPPVARAAASAAYGAALSAGAIKLRAREVAALPLPADHGAWAEGAALARAGAAAAAAERPALLGALGAVMTRAYGGGDDDLAWWMARWAPPGAAG